MLGSITPLGEWGRHSRWGLTFVAHLLGAGMGGYAAGTTFGLLGRAVGLGHFSGSQRLYFLSCRYGRRCWPLGHPPSRSL